MTDGAKCFTKIKRDSGADTSPLSTFDHLIVCLRTKQIFQGPLMRRFRDIGLKLEGLLESFLNIKEYYKRGQHQRLSKVQGRDQLIRRH